MKKKKSFPNLHYLYEAAVQGVENDLDIATRIFEKKRERKPVALREDFCGTAALACEWIKRSKNHRAWGVDIDQPTLDWGTEHNVTLLGNRAGNIKLLCDDVMKTKTPPADLLFALNFSYCIFKTRDLLRAWNERTHP